MAVTKIDRYEVAYSANQFVPRIFLTGGGKSLGQLVFKPNGAALPPDSVGGSGEVNVFYHLDDFQNAVDLLRNESPVYLFFNGPGPGNENGITTGQEMPGEGD